MRRPATMLTGAILTTVLAVAAHAQTTTQTGTGRGGSAHVKTDWSIGGANITIAYGRPSLKGRSEAQMMPVGKPWRTGADEATVITTDKPLTFGSVTLKPGSYTINTQPGEKAWELIFGKLEKAGQWGVPYRADLEIGRTPMTLGKAKSPAEQVTYSIDRSAGGQALRLEWGTVSARAPFTIGK